jgi:hypothetical protein
MSLLSLYACIIYIGAQGVTYDLCENWHCVESVERRESECLESVCFVNKSSSKYV